MKITCGKLKDCSELYDILNNTKELRGFSHGEAYSLSWMKEVVSDKKRNLVLIAENNGELVGFLIAHLLTGKDFFLNDLYVKQNYRGRGIASKLLYKFQRISDNIGSKFSMGLVFIKNKKMQNLFKKFGYLKGHTFYYYYKEIK